MNNHDYLEMYCENFNLKIANNKILDRKKKVVGSFESVKDKYVFFKNAGLMKKSDLLLSILENFGVH